MKKILLILGIAAIIASCASTKDTADSGTNKRELKKIAEKAVVKKAIESRRYIIKVDRVYSERGQIADLRPSNNFIIINGEQANVSLPYIGRSYGARPISGINFNGQTFKYELNSNEVKGLYEINMKVGKGNETFNVYLNVGAEGYCTFTINNMYISSLSYKGKLVPIPSRNAELTEDAIGVKL
jgi:hypothetical protein